MDLFNKCQQTARRLAFITVTWIFLCDPGIVRGQNSPALLTVHTAVPSGAENPMPFGFNYEGAGQMNLTDNHWVADSGFAPYENRFSFVAMSGTANSFYNDGTGSGTGWGTDYYDSINTGFFNGATAYTYRQTSDLKSWYLLRTDTVVAFGAVSPSKSSNQADHTVTFQNSGPAIQANDVIWLEQSSANYSSSWFAPRFQNGIAEPWGVLGDGPAGTLTHSRIADAPSGYNAGTPSQTLSCLSITSTQPQNVSLVEFTQGFQTTDDLGSGQEGFEAGHTYTASVWLKGTIPCVTFAISNTSISHNFSGINSTWQKFTYTIPAPYPTYCSQWQLKFYGQGNLEVDEFKVYDAATCPDTLNPLALSSWQAFKAGTMRIWSDFGNASAGFSFWSLDTWLTPEGVGRNAVDVGNPGIVSTPQEHLPTVLAYAKEINTQPWFIINMSWSQQEWSNFIDYLCGPSTSTYGAMRPASHPNPYTDDFNTIYVEFGDEEWGTQHTAPTDLNYAAWAHFMMDYAASNSNFNPAKIKFVVNGFSGGLNFGTSALANTTSASVIDYHNYTPGPGNSAQNSDFNTPTVSSGSHVANPSGSQVWWTFNDNSGVQNGDFGSPTPPEYNQLQTGFIQSNGTISQLINFPVVGSYLVEGNAAIQSTGGQPIIVKLDGATVGTFTPTSATTFTQFQVPFNVSSVGSHTVALVATATTGAANDFIDSLQVLPSSTSFYQTELLSLPSNYVNTIGGWVTAEQQSAAAGRPYTIATYEGGPGSDDPNQVGGGDNTLAAAVTYLDVLLYGSQSGVGPQNFHSYNLGTGGWTSHTDYANGYIPHPVWEALQMRNNYCNGPMTNVEVQSSPVTPDTNQYPLIGSYTFHDPAGYADVWVLSRDAVNSTPVTVSLPVVPSGAGTLYSLTGGSDGASANNDTGLKVPIASQSVNWGTTRSYSFTIPPSSAYLFVVPVASWPSAGPSGIQALASSSQIALSWNAYTGATSYNIYRATTQGNENYATPYATVSASSPMFFDSSATVGQTYFYRVTAVTSSGETDVSNEVSAGEGPAVGDGIFSGVNVGAAAYQTDPTGDAWTFTGNAGIQSNGSALGAPPAPDGTQTAFLQQAGSSGGSISQSLNFLASGSYTVSMEATTQAAGGETINVQLDGATVATITPPSNGFNLCTSGSFYVTTAGSHKIAFTSAATSGNLTDFFTDISFNLLPITNGNFQLPVVGSGSVNGSLVVGSGWTFNGLAGIMSSTDNGWQPTTGAAGSQYAYLQDLNASSGTGGVMTQTVNIVTPGTYSLSFHAAGPAYVSGQTITVSWDGTTIGTATTNSSVFTPFTTNVFNATPGAHTLQMSVPAVYGVNLISQVDSIVLNQIPVSNGSFETPTVGSGGTEYDLTSASSSWTFTGDSGITSNGNGWGSDTTDGTQYAFLQESSGNPGQMSQSVYVAAPGTYAVSFQVSSAAYAGWADPLVVSLDGTVIGNVTPNSANFSWFTTNTFDVSTPGTHILTIAATGTTDIKTTLVDSVTFLPVSVSGNSGAAVGPAIGDGNFSSIDVGAANYEYDPTGDVWTFSGDAGIQSNGSGWAAPDAPDGTQTAFIQQSGYYGGYISQIFNFTSPGSYAVSMQAANRSSGGETINVQLDGALVGSITPPSTDWTLCSTGGFFVPTGGYHTITFVSDVTSGDLADFFTDVAINPVPVANGGFETPVLANGTTLYDSSIGDSLWAFTGDSGITANGNGWGPSTTDGNQYAFVQESNGNPGVMSQSVNIQAAGTYVVSFKVAGATNAGAPDPITVSWNGTTIGTVTPASSTFSSFTTSSFGVSSPGANTLTISATGTSGLQTTVIDAVTIAPGGP